MGRFKPTDQQQKVIDHQGDACVDAVAGSGKTATLIEFAKKRPSKRILYIAYNRSVKLESQQRFMAAGCRNVRVETAHSLAYAGFGVRGRYELTHNMSILDIAEFCGLQPTPKSPQAHLVMAKHISTAMNYFCNSDIDRVDTIDYSKALRGSEGLGFARKYEGQILDYARQILGAMYHGKIPLVHDAYLKFFQLTRPSLSHYDIVLVDEAQDISMAMLDVFLNQTDCTRILVGDEHQSIYGFRYSVNAMKRAGFAHFPLTNSFRFGNEIARSANTILAFKPLLDSTVKVPTIVGAGPSSGNGSEAILARGNLQLLGSALDIVVSRDDKLHFEGGLQNYTCMGEGSSLFDILFLRTMQRSKIRSKFIRSFTDYEQLAEYIEATGDQELRLASKIVEKYSMLLFDLIRKLKAAQVDRKDADLIFSTVHKAKGAEYDNVTLCEGFYTREKLFDFKRDLRQDPGKKDELPLHYEEINIFYVAATRAIKKLKVDFIF